MQRFSLHLAHTITLKLKDCLLKDYLLRFNSRYNYCLQTLLFSLNKEKTGETIHTLHILKWWRDIIRFCLTQFDHCIIWCQKPARLLFEVKISCLLYHLSACVIIIRIYIYVVVWDACVNVNCRKPYPSEKSGTRLAIK